MVSTVRDRRLDIRHRDLGRASDLVQDTLERALRKRASFLPGTNVRAWLLTIMTHLFLDQLRRKQIVSEVASLDALEIAADPPVPELRVTTEELQAAVAELPEELRAVVRLHDLEGLGYRAIAERLGIPMGTVGTRLARARARLHTVLRAGKADR